MWLWLVDLNSTQAFLVCMGAGPWGPTRREKVQTAALEAHAAQGHPDLADMDLQSLPYPLSWQRKKIEAMQNFLVTTPPFESRCSFQTFCNTLILDNHGPKPLYDVVGRSKVVELFVRDHLKLPAFPIDRHVRRTLESGIMSERCEWNPKYKTPSEDPPAEGDCPIRR